MAPAVDVALVMLQTNGNSQVSLSIRARSNATSSGAEAGVSVVSLGGIVVSLPSFNLISTNCTFPMELVTPRYHETGEARLRLGLFWG